MADFGEVLRECRQRCKDPENPRRVLSQGRLGELLGRELNMQGGYSATAISDWERSKSKINADQRLVLISLVKTLHQLGGLKTSSEANELLEAGNYRALNLDEKRNIFPQESTTESSEVPTNKSAGNQQTLKFPLAEKISELSDEFQRLLTEAEEGPSPSWPRVIARLLRKFMDYWSISKMVTVLFWLWVWILTWRLIAPSLRLPFTSPENAEIALKIYIAGTLAAPLLIGLLTDTKHNKFWQEHNLALNYVTRLYTYQGAGVGFHLGYFTIFAIHLMGYYLKLHVPLWFEFLEMGTILLWGYLGAHVIPYNLWRAYGRLHLADGWIFFIFLVLGLFWSFFFLEFYPVFLSSVTGGLIVLLSITLLILITAWRQYHNTLRK